MSASELTMLLSRGQAGAALALLAVAMPTMPSRAHVAAAVTSLIRTDFLYGLVVVISASLG
jgi:hypothetical protein